MKQRIAQFFSELLQQKPLEQITVKELTEALGISRIVSDEDAHRLMAKTIGRWALYSLWGSAG